MFFKLEIIYDYSKDDINEYRHYLKVERQYIEIIKRFWGISPVYILNNMNTELLEFLKDYTDKKSAERPLSDVQTGAPRNENRFASSNRHRTKKKRLAFSKEKETRRGTSR